MSHQASRLNILQGGASSSRISLDSTLHQFPSSLTQDQPRVGQAVAGRSNDKYDISNLLTDPSSSSAFLPSLPSLSQNTYLPTQLTSLGTTFTSSGTLPRSSTPGGKSVAQRRSQAPPLVQTELRKVGREEFQGYLKEVGEEYDNWVRESRLAKEEMEDEEEESLRGDEGGDEMGSPKKQMSKKRRKRKEQEELENLPPLDQVPSIFFDPSFNLSNPRTFDLVTERIQLTPSSSPSLTFSPRLASAIHDSADELVIPGLGPTTLNDLASDQLLQEKLSHFTAVIESHLVREIGLRSSSFFSALSNLQHLHQQGSSALSKIEELKLKLGDKEGGVNGTARHGLKILRLQARRRGLERIDESVRAVEEVASALEGVKELVENGEWGDALEVAESIQEAFERSALPAPPQLSTSSSNSTLSRSSPPNQGLNLTKLTALRSLPLKLSLIRAQIAKSLEGELISVLEHEMDLGIEAGIKRGRRKATDSHESSEGGIEENDEGSERTKERTRPVVQALVRSEGMDSAVQAWRESVLREIRAMVREHLPTSEDGAAGEEEEDPFAHAAVRSVSKQSIDLGTVSDKSLSLAKKLRAMSHEAFLRLAQETYLGLIACIETVDLQAQILLELVSQSREEEKARKSRRRNANGLEAANPPATSSLVVPGTEPSAPTAFSSVTSSFSNGISEDSASSLSTEITDVLTAVTELSNVRFSKVIGVRSEVHSQLPLEQFLEIFDQTWSFVLQCEVIVKRMIVGLRGAMVSQSKAWLMTFHQRRINENAKLVEEEQWSASEVPLKVQKNVELIVKGAMADPEELLLGHRSKEIATTGGGEERAAAAKQVDIEGRQFFAVSAGLATIDTLVEYVQVVLNCPMLTTDAMSKIIEFMKVFNSRACQVVLGAGAMRSAGLKNITAKNLALASQALSIMVSLIPYIRELIRRHLNPKQAVMLTEFDKLKRDYQEHQNEIHFKLVAIMSDRLIVHSRTLETLNWEEASSKPGQPNAYMEALVKEHLTLYKVLSRFLHAETVFSIMSQVFKALDSKLGEEYIRIDFKSEEAKERVLVDVRYLQEKLGGLKGLEESSPGKAIETLVLAKSLPVNAKVIPAPAPAPPPPAPPANDDSSALRPPPAAIETPLPATPSLWTSLPPSASASALSLALPDAPSTPRTSLDAPASNYSPPVPPRNRSPSPGPQPPSPVPVPAPLPPSPKPGPAPYKKKSLAERLAERMGRKPAEAVPPQQPSRSSLEFEQRPPQTGAEQPRVEKSEDEKLLEEVQKEIPVWTPKGEKELEEVEKQVEEEVRAQGLGISSTSAEERKSLEEPKVESAGPVVEGNGGRMLEETSKAEEIGFKQEDKLDSVKEDQHQAEALVEPSKDESIVEPESPTEPSSDPEDSSTSTVPAVSPQDEDTLPAKEEEDHPTESASHELHETSLVIEPPTPEEDAQPAPIDLSETSKILEGDKASSPVVETPSEPEKPCRPVELPIAEPSTAAESPTELAPASTETSTKASKPPTEEVKASAETSEVPPPISISTAASIPAPPSAPSTPVSSPPPRSSSMSSLPEIASPPPADSSNPPRKKTLKERLAEAARRGSTGSSLVNATSPPSVAARPLLDLPAHQEVKEENGTTPAQASTPSTAANGDPASVPAAPSDAVSSAGVERKEGGQEDSVTVKNE